MQSIFQETLLVNTIQPIDHIIWIYAEKIYVAILAILEWDLYTGHII